MAVSGGSYVLLLLFIFQWEISACLYRWSWNFVASS